MQERFRRVVERLSANRLIAYSLIGLSFLWPFYQRAFFRVTLFYRLQDLSQTWFDVFLIVFLAGALALALPPLHRRTETYLSEHRSAVIAAAILSAIATLYLSGTVAPTVGGTQEIAFDTLATVAYALSILVVSAVWLLLIMRIVYEKSLFSAVVVLVASGMIGSALSPTFATSYVSTGLVPVFGILISGLCAWFAHPHLSGTADRSAYQPLSKAPYLKTWLIPLVSYFLLSVLHALSYANDVTAEVHVLNGELAAAASTVADYGVFFLFSAFLLAAAVNSWNKARSDQEKATFWVAMMGVSVGLFLGLLLADPLNGSAPSESVALSAITRCFTTLLVVVVLFLTYQNRLSPLQSFGLFFFSAYAAEKVLAYIIFPLFIDWLGPLSPLAEHMVNTLVPPATSAVMLLFLIKLCRGNALRLLFSVDTPVRDDEHTSALRDARDAACRAVAAEFGLTKRELDILRPLAFGHSAKRIGETLCISERTVQTHSQNMYRKLGVHNRQMVIDLVEERTATEQPPPYSPNERSTFTSASSGR